MVDVAFTGGYVLIEREVTGGCEMVRKEENFVGRVSEKSE